MGFSHDLVVAALKHSKNDLQRALDLLQTNSDELLQSLPKKENADSDILEQLKELGFNEEIVRVALETTQNDPGKALDFLVKIFGNEEDLLKQISRIAEATKEIVGDDTPSTSSGLSSLASTAMDKVKNEIESLRAYERFNEDLTSNGQDYLDLPLLQEEQILAEYKRFLEQ
ncbi:uncharacterized protein LOC128858361 [Anastrepha ludens]|nr:uncharacterized protein LOC128858361 [Anastrepha ludens]